MRNELRQLNKKEKDTMNPIDAYLQNTYQQRIVHIETAIRDAWYTDSEWEAYVSTLTHQPVYVPKPKPVKKTNFNNKKKQAPIRETRPESKPESKPETKTNENETKPFVKTRMCRHTLAGRKCNYKNCTYAHDLSEYFPLECRFQFKCRNKNCNYIHPDESKQSFLDRTS
jgi:hypothetical protein